MNKEFNKKELQEIKDFRKYYLNAGYIEIASVIYRTYDGVKKKMELFKIDEDGDFTLGIFTKNETTYCIYYTPGEGIDWFLLTSPTDKLKPKIVEIVKGEHTGLITSFFLMGACI